MLVGNVLPYCHVSGDIIIMCNILRINVIKRPLLVEDIHAKNSTHCFTVLSHTLDRFVRSVDLS